MKTWFLTLAFGFIILAGISYMWKTGDPQLCTTMAIFWLLACEFEK